MSYHKPSCRIRPAVILLAFVLLVASCRGRSPEPTPTPTPPPPGVSTPTIPSADAAASVKPETGGTIALETGADITFPPQSVSAVTVVTFRTVDAPSAAPVPRSHIGAVYSVALEGGEITGIPLVRLPLPPGVGPDSYDLAPYRWNGSTWERAIGRVHDGYIQFGINKPGEFVIQGQWRFADAALGLIKTDAIAGQELVPLSVVGQYRFSALPALDGEYVRALLTLKQDTSGGAGRATGVEDLDASVEEAPLLFKPDPSDPQGLIEFNHVFELRPDLLDLKPGASTRFYALLTVDDSAAPTRRVSSGVEYSQVLAIQIVEGDVVRPVLANESRYSLRWNVTLNGEPFFQEQATADRLAIQPLINRGGVGDYRVVLEVEQEGAWAPVSNEVTFQLALRPSATPEPGQEPVGTLVAQNNATATPTRDASGPVPVPPTRRPTPDNRPGEVVATPTPAVVAQVTPTATATPPRVNGTTAFWADKGNVIAGECANLNWQVEGVLAVFLDNAPVTGRETRQVCPTRTTTYTLRTQTAAGFQDRTVTIVVVGATSTPGATDISFTADVYQVAPGGCATLSWRAVNVRAVFLNGQGVAGEASQQVCPPNTTEYVLRVETTSGQSQTRTLTIVVSTAAGGNPVRFWAEQYALASGGCTTLHWRVQNVRQVFLDEQGVAGEGTSQVCPTGVQFYTLRIIDNGGQETYREVTLTAGDVNLAPTEVIAQGIVRSVSNQADINPAAPGDQPGYVLGIDGINVIFVGANGFAQGSVSLRVPEEAISYEFSGPVDWPIRVGQGVEFRAGCEGNVCSIDLQTNSYVFLRTE